MFVDYYSLLEISSKSSIEEIKNAYKKQAMRWHPDKNSQDTTHRMQLINEAKLILLDEEARKRYDIEYLIFIQSQKDEKFKQANTKKEPEFEKKEAHSYEYKEYNIQDDILKSWIQNARKQAKEIIKETIELSSVGGKAALQELKYGFGCWFIGLIIIGFIFVLIKLFN
jgi:curved DNA-binding protein CbpA